MTTESYYRVIGGVKYDKKALDLCDEVTKAKGDGRISKGDAARLFDLIKDGDSYTDVEKHTVKYIRGNYKWTEAADTWFRAEVRKWASTKNVPTKDLPPA